MLSDIYGFSKKLDHSMILLRKTFIDRHGEEHSIYGIKLPTIEKRT